MATSAGVNLGKMETESCALLPVPPRLFLAREAIREPELALFPPTPTPPDGCLLTLTGAVVVG
eukprot:CAMPEP_0182590258 /NCGR_PEP_ID=MMETSP1324-20130603/71323_1 /TAXON_ID=236786 /ORGANISM="Florenciella sp., Strain RCC1587" /LENGTH=62 /DNA_ID=CAMNT_0024807469 /DNA_START=200 /DNA_END=385 /DNA_ORIENTATION=-